MSPIKKKGKKTKHPGIRKLQDGRWHVRRKWVNPNTGVTEDHVKIVAGTLEQAQRARADLRKDAPSGAPQLRPRLREFAADWLASRKSKLELSTVERYTDEVANLNIEFGDWWVDMISFDALEQWQNRMCALVEVPKSDPTRKAPLYAAPTINGWHRTLKLILDPAVRRGLLRSNPARQLPALPEKRTKGARGTALTVTQLLALVDAIPVGVEKAKYSPETARGLCVYAWTGMRAGEILALRWSDVVDGELRVENSVWRGHGKSDKTDDPRRITIVEPLVAVLEEQRRWLMREQHPGLESGLVFPASPMQARAGAKRRKGDVHWYRSQTTFQDAVAAACELAELPRISPHALRRTMEDLTREAKVDKLVRQAILGWREDATQDGYARVRREERDAAAAALVQYVMGARR